MEKVIVVTPDELKTLITEAIQQLIPKEKPSEQVSETISLNDALIFLREQGYTTSKGKIYQLTSQGKIPFGKYGNKLVFSRKELLNWAETQTIRVNDKSEGLLPIIKSANNKRG